MIVLEQLKSDQLPRKDSASLNCRGHGLSLCFMDQIYIICILSTEHVKNDFIQVLATNEMNDVGYVFFQKYVRVLFGMMHTN
jgi:hypothetical protein